MSKYINASMLEKDGWYMQRIRQSSETGVYISETKKPTDFPAADIPQWIPVTERLPKESGEYLVTIGPMLYFSWFYKDDMWSFKNADITAWMPLPEPYRGGEEE